MSLKMMWKKWIPRWDSVSRSVLDDDDDDDDDDQMTNLPLLMTRSGPIPLQDIHPMKEFNFWTVHTNFPISENIAEMIDTMPGVEAFNVLSPVRMRVATGELFDANQVQLEIGYSIKKLYEDYEQEEDEYDVDDDPNNKGETSSKQHLDG